MLHWLQQTEGRVGTTIAVYLVGLFNAREPLVRSGVLELAGRALLALAFLRLARATTKELAYTADGLRQAFAIVLQVVEVGAVVRNNVIVVVLVARLCIFREALKPLVVGSILVCPLRACLALALLSVAGTTAQELAYTALRLFFAHAVRLWKRSFSYGPRYSPPVEPFDGRKNKVPTVCLLTSRSSRLEQ